MATVPTTHTVAVGDKVTASDENTYVRDAVAFLLDPPRARAYQGTTGTTLTTAVTSVLLFDSEDWDTDSIHSTSANTSRMTFTTAGRYLIIAQVTFPANATGQRTVSIRKNAAGASGGGSFLAAEVSNAAGSGSHVMQLVWEDTFVATDYIEVFALQSSGGNLTTTLGANQTACIVRRISA